MAESNVTCPEAESEKEFYECICGLGDKFFTKIYDCSYKCYKGGFYPKTNPREIKEYHCSLAKDPDSDFDTIESDSSISAILATATEPGEYLVTGTYEDGKNWYECYTVEENELSSRGKVTATNSSKQSEENEDTKSSTNDSKTTTNGAQILGVSLLSLFVMVFL